MPARRGAAAHGAAIQDQDLQPLRGALRCAGGPDDAGAHDDDVIGLLQGRIPQQKGSLSIQEQGGLRVDEGRARDGRQDPAVFGVGGSDP